MALNKPLVAPSIKELEEIAKRQGIPVKEEELVEYKAFISKSMEAYKKLDEMEEPLLPVKYPRSSVYKPSKEENPLNAWWYKTDIKGASSGKLLGKRVAIKDSILVAGVPMCCGSDLLEGYIPNEDATVVTRVLDEGAVVVGKTNCEDLCRSGNSFTCVNGPILNPYDKTRSSGGSSCGNSVLLQQGEIDLAIGGDQGGSVRIPSSWCGTVGLKPTHGLVPYTGAMACEGIYDHLGPMTKNVEDCALLLEVIAGWDNGYDPRQRSDKIIPEYSKLLTSDISGKKLAVLSEGYKDCHDDVIEVVKGALTQLKETCGIVMEEVSIPEHDVLGSILYTAMGESYVTTAFENAGAMQGVKSHQNIGCIDHMRAGFKNKTDQFSHSLKCGFICGTYMKETFGMRYAAKAANLLPKLVQLYDDVLANYDAILMPTLTYKAPKLPSPENIKTLKDYSDHCFSMTNNTSPFNLTGHPALSMNVGFSEGLPIGLQIVGKHWDETTVLNVAYAFEKNLKKL